MRINNNISALNTHRQMSVNTNNATKSMEKLSTGLRINRASDDAAGLSISEKMRSQIRGLNQATSNAQDAISLIQTAEGALTEVSSMLTRVKELAVQKTNGTYSDDDIENIGKEMDALGAEMNNILSTTAFNGKNVFENKFDIIIGHDGENKLTVAASDGELSTIYVKSGTPGKHGTAKIEATTSAKEVDAAIDAVNTQRAVYGSQQNRLEHTINNLGTTSENLTAAESRIRDTDMAKEMSEMTKNNVLKQAAQAMLAQANQQPQSVLQLLQ